MASVDQTLTELIRAFPCAYPDRTQALHQVLVVLGSGYEWRGGEAVQRFDSDGRGCLSVHGQFKLSASLAERFREYGEEVSQEDIDGTCPAEHLRTRAAELARTPGPLRQDPYPPSTLAPLFNVAEDAAADWVAAAREIAAVVVPLWVNPSAYELTINFSLTCEQRAYAYGEQTKAFALLESRFGPGVVYGGGC
ncbi:hypothetical protein [Embleya sp. MST-111070]|uniref:hypothetical protein n=1 Tax=Embleya sp. MST-111070 TaxID=3398231 RepID=UPI003F7331B7